MSSPSKALLAAAVAVGLVAPALGGDYGRPATPADIAAWDIDVAPDGEGLPAGRGTVADGQGVYATSCSACHGARGGGGIGDRLVGGEGTLASAAPVKTVGSFWPYATTLFDYIRRAMPYQSPGRLSDDETYAVTAYILHLNGILPEGAALDRDSLPAVKMPNRDGFVPDPDFDPATLFGTAGASAGQGAQSAEIDRSELMSVDGLITVRSAFDPQETMARLQAAVRARGLTVFAHVDHAAGAAEAGQSLRPTDLLVFGAAKGGTPLMQAAQTAGIDLPLKALVWQDEAGATNLSYNDPAWIAARHGIDGALPAVQAMSNALNDLAARATIPQGDTPDAGSSDAQPGAAAN